MKNLKIGILKKYSASSLKALFIIAIIVLVFWWLAPLFEVPAPYLVVPLVAGVASGVLNMHMNRLLNALTYFVPNSLLDEDAEVVQKGELRIAELKKMNYQNNNERFLPLIKALESQVGICQVIMESSTAPQSYLKLFIRDLKTLMKMPSQSLAQKYFATLSDREIEERRETISAELRELLTPYDFASKKVLTDFLTQVLHQVLPDRKMRGEHVRVKPLLIVGPPGVGKTFLIKAIARIFKMPLSKQNMGTFTLERFEGKQLPSPSGFTTTQPGKFVQTLTHERKNPNACHDNFFLMDELDKGFTKGKEGMSERTEKLIGFLHPILQVDQLWAQDLGFNIPVYLGGTVMIANANRNCFVDDYIPLETRKSLQDRVTLLVMPPLSQAAKLSIIEKKMKKLIEKDEGTTEKQKLILHSVMHRKMVKIVEEDQNPGLRDALTELGKSYLPTYFAGFVKNGGLKSVSQIILDYSTEGSAITASPKETAVSIVSASAREAIQETNDWVINIAELRRAAI